MRHARACLPKRAELNHERSTPRVRRARDPCARTFRRAAQLGGGTPALLARCVVRSAKGPIRILCMPHPTLSGCRSSSARRSSEPMTAGALWRGRQQMLRSAREAPDGFQRLGRRTRTQSRGPVHDSATTWHSQARMCSSVGTHPFMVPPSRHMART
jgi:hypothetical protein